MVKNSWAAMLRGAMVVHGDELEDLVDCVPAIDSPDMQGEFNTGYGSTEGCAFTAWTDERVYFPVQYDGAEWVESVPRHPDGTATGHVGGG